MLAFVNPLLADLEDGLVARWDFSSNAFDTSGNGNHGDVQGGVAPTADRFGNPGSAYSFDGTSGYIDVAYAESLNPTAAITITAWFKADSFALGSYSWPPILAKYGSGLGGYDLAIQKVYEGTPRIGSSVCTTGEGWLTLHDWPPAEPVSAGIWYFTAMTYDGSALTSYSREKDETSLIVLSMSGSGGLVTSSYDLNIGRSPYNTSRYFNGVIDDLRIYDRALSSTEIEQIAALPEPATLAMLGLGGLAILRRRKK